jgi:hypothetical protein
MRRKYTLPETICPTILGEQKHVKPVSTRRSFCSPERKPRIALKFANLNIAVYVTISNGRFGAGLFELAVQLCFLSQATGCVNVQIGHGMDKLAP